MPFKAMHLYCSISIRRNGAINVVSICQPINTSTSTRYQTFCFTSLQLSITAGAGRGHEVDNCVWSSVPTLCH